MARKKVETSVERSKKFKRTMTDGIRNKEGAMLLPESNEQEIIVRTQDVCVYDDFLRGLENDTNNLLSRAMKC